MKVDYIVTGIRKPDITKAKNILNWEPKVSRTDGLKVTIRIF